MCARIAASTVAALAVAGCALAQTPASDEDHSAHHPPAGAPTSQVAGPRDPVAPDAFDKQMRAMQDMHRRMQAAQTPSERGALMDEHMRLLRSGMAMMRQMRGSGGMGGPGSMGMMPPQASTPGAGQGAPAMHGMAGKMGMHQQIERRMAMMEEMMQMMMDREAAIPRK